MTNIIAAVRSVLTYVVVSLYLLLAGPIALAIGIGFKNKTALYVPGHIGVGLALGLAGIRYRVRGREHIPANRAVVRGRCRPTAPRGSGGCLRGTDRRTRRA